MLDDVRVEDESRIEAWMLRAVRSDGPDYWQRLSLPDRFSERTLWLTGAAEYFEATLRVRDRLKVPVAVMLAMLLKPSESPRGVQSPSTGARVVCDRDLIDSLDELEIQLGEEPPAFIMTAGGEPVSAEERASQRSDKPLLLGGHGIRRSVREWFDPTVRLYLRALWILG
jgi:hypothetical protein